MCEAESFHADFFVAVNGSDTNPGTEEKPFATLQRARDAVRELKSTKEGPITVLVRGGTYYLEEPLVFEPWDSGTKDQPITYAAYPGEKPVISGGRKIVGKWRPSRDGIMMCSLSEVKAGKLYFTQLFVNGKRQIRARYPNYDPENPLVDGNGYINAKDGLPEETELERITRQDGLKSPHSAPKGMIFDPKTFTSKRWAKPKEAVIHIFPTTYWGNLQWEIEKIDWENHMIFFGRGGFQFGLHCQIKGNSRFYVENIFEELDTPGEWYLDKQAGVLYYMPPERVDLESADVEVPVLEMVVEFRGSQDEPVQYITISGFRITHTTSTFLESYEAPSGGDWTIHRGGAVFFEGAEYCVVEKCFFDGVGGNCVFFNNYNRNNRVVGCKFTEAGESAVCLVGSRHLTYGNMMAFPSDNLIYNNLIHDCGVFGKQVAGVFCANAMRTTISHNLIYNMPRAGICFNDGWGGGHVVEYNEVYNAVQETSDHGPFNSWGRERYWCLTQAHASGFTFPHPIYNVKRAAQETTIIRNNYFHQDEPLSEVSRGFGERTVYFWGIDLDDGSSNYHVYNNLCVGCSIKLRDGDYRTVENNIVVDPVANQVSFHVGYDNNHDVFRRNIIVTKGDIYTVGSPPITTPWLEEIDYNSFFNYQQEFSVTVRSRDGSVRKYTLAQWQNLGYDTHSIFADPLFVDPENGDYRVRPESPALKLGFKNFDMDKFGLLPDFPKQWRN